jgi:pimeloyl-ACP methyl ester carboxylesterase
MPYTNNKGFKIYYEVEGEGTPLVLLYGLTGSTETMNQSGYVAVLKDDFQLILVDARGHGASDKPHNPEAYKLELMVEDVVAVLDDLNIDKVHFLGYSMGGWISLGIAKYAPDRVLSLIIGGYGPMNEWSTVERNAFLDLFGKGMDHFLENFGKMFGKWWTPEIKAIVESNDLDALIALVSAKDFIALPGLDDLLPTVSVPCLFYIGEEDEGYLRQKECIKRMTNTTFISFPGLNHIEAGFRIDLLLPHVTKFLTEVNLDR